MMKSFPGSVLAENQLFHRPIPAMKQTPMPKPTAPATAATALMVVSVYQDVGGREWATELRPRMMQMLGNATIANSSWKLVELEGSESFSEAVSAAILADILVISIRTGEEFPPRLSAWIETWLPRRKRKDGALIAVLGMDAGQTDVSSERLKDYLRSVASRGRLNLTFREPVEVLPPSETETPDDLAFAETSFIHWSKD
jgi:hypothetical protein